MGIDADSPHTVHAGTLVARRLRASGIDTVFTLSGGHIFPIYDGCRSEGIRLIDTRHEQTAAFAAEGWSKVTRVPGVVALTELLAKSLAPRIRVNAVAPGAVLLPEGWDAEARARLVASTPLGRLGTPDDVVRAVLFLLENDYLTGTTLVVDGGRLLR